MIKKILFSITFLLAIFLEPFVNSINAVIGNEAPEGVLSKFAILVFVLTILLKLIYGFNKADRSIVGVLALFGSLYFLTSLFAGSSMPDVYVSMLLRWGALCVSCTFLGNLYCMQNDYRLFCKLLFVSIVILTLLITVAYSISLESLKLLDNENGLNYQNVAYYMALLFGMTSFILIHLRKDESHSIIMNIVLLTLLLIQAIIAVFSGGRGGCLLVVIEAIWLLLYLFKAKVVNKFFIIVVLMAIFIAGIYIVNKFELTETAGFSRMENFTRNNREDNYTLAMQSFEESVLIGHGLGSDFYSKLGYYYHNVFLDWLCEGGIIGCFILFIFFKKVSSVMIKAVRRNYLYGVPLVFFIYGCFVSLFSNYWFSSESYWMGIGVFLTLSKKLQLYKK